MGQATRLAGATGGRFATGRRVDAVGAVPTNGEIAFAPALGGEGREHDAARSTYPALRMASDRRLREAAYPRRGYGNR